MTPILPNPMGVAVVGYGYWGPNIVRNLMERPEFRLLALCETSSERARAFSSRYPDVPVTSELDLALLDPRIEAVFVATPPRTHFELVHRSLLAGKHVLVEKPLAKTSHDAATLLSLAEGLGLVLMPGHTFIYSPPVNLVRNLIDEGELGEIHFITSTRMNLGLYQGDGVICDLAPHDLSILLYWLQRPVTGVVATGQSVYQPGVPETAFLSLSFEGDVKANVQISWLAPRKVRQIVIVGSKRMVQYDDTALDDVVRVYDRGLEFNTPENFGEYKLTYRSGDMVAPRIDAAEPLGLELEDFANAIRTGTAPRSSARLGFAVVRAMEAAQQSLAVGGRPVSLHGDEYLSDGLAPDLTHPQLLAIDGGR